MKSFLSFLMLGFLFMSPVKAETVAIPEQPEPVVDTASASASADILDMKEVTLKDGTKISIEGQNVFVVSDDGTKTPAPDGVHSLADGSTITTKGGTLVGE